MRNLGRVRGIRFFLGCAVALAATLVVTGCFETSNSTSTVIITYHNNTDSLFCKYTSPFSDRTRCSTPIQPNAETISGQDCYIDADVYLVEESTGDEIYYREARCEEWDDAGRIISIDREGDRFVVTDGFEDATGDPSE